MKTQLWSALPTKMLSVFFQLRRFFSAVFAILVAVGLTFETSTYTRAGEVRFDVNDVSFLWPIPQSPADVGLLVSADEQLPDRDGTIWPADEFLAVIEQAQKISVTNSAGRQSRINFQPFNQEFAKRSTWKVVSFRVDPSAAGTKPEFIQEFGEIPQIRLVLQPVTVSENGAIRIHDVSVHLVFSFVIPLDIQAGQRQRFGPDRTSFQTVIADLVDLKSTAEKNGAATSGQLTVHPGFRKDLSGFSAKVRAFLLKHVDPKRLSAIAFMGIDPPEPWIFFAMNKSETGLKLQSFPMLGGNSSQMLILRGGSPVVPTPVTTNLDARRGVHTSLLFSRTIREQLDMPVFQDLPNLKHRDIPNVIANPTRSHFFNTDCVSCHTESSRRTVLGIGNSDRDFQYQAPDGISSVDEALLPKDQWNVRNFGWFPTGTKGGVATVTMRTANESAESADFVNCHYLSDQSSIVPGQ